MTQKLLACAINTLSLIILAACSFAQPRPAMKPSPELPLESITAPNNSKEKPSSTATDPAELHRLTLTAEPISAQPTGVLFESPPATLPESTMEEPGVSPELTQEITKTDTPKITNPTPTSACETFSATLEIEPSQSQLTIGEMLTVTGTLSNTGCSMLGLPQYNLVLTENEGNPTFEPTQPGTILHTLGLTPGTKDVVQFTLQPTSSGTATFLITASFEVHIGYPGPAYWHSAASPSITIDIQP